MTVVHRALLALALSLAAATASEPADILVERVSTAIPFPRGLAVADGKLHVLARGRVRGAGGVSSSVEDQAGTIFVVDMAIAEPLSPLGAAERGEPAGDEVGAAVRANGRVLAAPTDPPFRLWDRDADPPASDRWTDRPYCCLRWHEASQSFYLCAFSGIDKPRTPGERSFSKNLSDAVLRYDLRDSRWHEVERHDVEAGGSYPHHDPARAAPPHGWLNGPDNCLVIGDWLYVVAKDNDRLVRYDLARIVRSSDAPPPASEVVLGSSFFVRDHGLRRYHGHSALAYHDGWLYLATRTSSTIVRFRLSDEHVPVSPIVCELIATFDAYDPETDRSANLTDMAFDDRGRLYVVSAEPARIYRIQPDPDAPLDARGGASEPWLDLAARTGNPHTKSENLLFHAGHLYITSGDGYGYQAGAAGTVYRAAVRD